MKKNIIEIIKYSAIILLIFIAITVLSSSILFLCHISITDKNIVLSIVLTILLVMYISKNKNKCNMLIASVLAIVVFIISIFICTHTYDLTWDGNTYHKLAVGMLKDGWNPVYQDAKEFITEDPKDMGIIDDDRNSIWIEHYPKASWIFSANIYSATNNIESSKVINALFIYIGFGIIFSYIAKKINLFFAICIALLTVINPISIVQVCGFYIDGLMGICIYIILCTLIALSDKKNENDKKENALILAMTLFICINLKFTGFVYAAIFCFMFFVLWIYRAYKQKNIKEKLKEYICYYLVVLTISVGVIGFSPYIKNIKNKGNPFYPLMGKNKVDIISYNQPKVFKEKNSIEKFCISLFGMSENIKSNTSDKEPTTKMIFTFNQNELKEYNRPDLRISGFGVWFSGIFCLTLIGIIYVLINLYRKRK